MRVASALATFVSARRSTVTIPKHSSAHDVCCVMNTPMFRPVCQASRFPLAVAAAMTRT